MRVSRGLSPTSPVRISQVETPAPQAREFCYNILVLAWRVLRGEQPMRGRNPDKAIRFFALTRKRRSRRNLAVSNEGAEFDEVAQTVLCRLACPCLLFPSWARQGLVWKETDEARIFVCPKPLSSPPRRRAYAGCPVVTPYLRR